MVHNLPDQMTPKVHFVTDCARLIGMNGPAMNFWCMRFEGSINISSNWHLGR